MSDAEWKDGIPPVGTLVEYVDTEYRGESGEWVDNHIGSSDTAIFIAKYKGDYILAYKDMSGGVVACSIRPIKTAADIEREEVVKDLMYFMENAPSHEIAARSIVFKGYRLPVEQGEVVSADAFYNEHVMSNGRCSVIERLNAHFIITRKPNS